MLYSMKNPLIFGLSNAEEVTDGSVVSEQNDDVITVNSSGTVSKKSIAEIINQTEDTPTSGTLDGGGSLTLNATGGTNPGTGADLYQGYIFSSQSIVANGVGDINPDSEPYFKAGNGACIKNTLGSAPCDMGAAGWIGDTFEVQLANGNVVRFKLLSVSPADISIDWQYH